MERWFIVRNIETNQDIMSTIRGKDIEEFLKDKDLSKFRIDILYFKPYQKSVSAESFLSKGE